MDEIDRASASISTILHAILDDASIAALTLPTGEVVTAKKGLIVVATSNATPTDLEPAILDRFEVVLRCDTPHEGILKSLPSEWAAIIQSQYDRMDSKPIELEPSARRVMAANKLTIALASEPDGEDAALFAVFGSSAQEIASVLASIRSQGV
jgi:MoxR-like ATPase